MDLNAIHYFSAVAESNSFQLAAQKLAVPKSTLSRKIAELETSLGVQLFNRTTRQVSLTEVGALIYHHAQRIDDELESILALALNSSTHPKGTLRITAPITLGRIALGKWISGFQTLYPDIKLEVHLSDSYEDLVKGQFDVAIRVGRLEDSSLISRQICSTPKWILGTPAYAREQPLQTLEQLAQHKIVCLKTRQVSADSWALQKDGQHINLQIRPNIIVNDMMTMLEMLKSGAGIGLVPVFAARQLLDKGELIQLLPDVQGEPASFHIVYHKRSNLPKKVRVFIDYISEATRSEELFQH
ncbi:MAG: LysR family transcriptional regulator [Gammaproteobacteria bacterium]|nr:LysR family transcriptional regulator [Gammaproteobacteria bacterium]